MSWEASSAWAPGDPQGGGEGGAGPGDGGPIAYQWSQVRVKKQVSPQFPEAARQLEQEGACTLRFFIDEKGHPTRVEVERCPTVFRDAALEAAWKWTFYPMKEQGRPVPATFALTFRFQLSD